METAGQRDQVWQELVRVQLQAKDLESALTFAKLIEKDSTRDGRLNSIAQKQVQASDLNQALAIAKLMRTGMRDQVLESMVKVYTRNEDLANALALAKLITSDNTRQTRLYHIAQSQVQAGDLQAASSTAQLMQPGSLKDQILNAVGQ